MAEADKWGKRGSRINSFSPGIIVTPRAIDQAACDLVFGAPDSKDVIERIESRHGLRQLSAMREKKIGNQQYELITLN